MLPSQPEAVVAQMTESDTNEDVQFKLQIKMLSGKTYEVIVSEQTSVAALREAIRDAMGLIPDQQRLIWRGKELAMDNDAALVGSCGINAGAASTNAIWVIALVRRKPIIYIMSPIDRRVKVELSLSNKWKFTTIYPLTLIQSDRRSQCETVKWNVLAHSNGELTDESSGRDIAYLFWEAAYANIFHRSLKDVTESPFSRAVSSGPPSPPSSPNLHHDGRGEAAFDPSDHVVNEGNSVFLSVDNVPEYLDDTLQALGLHTEARTSFITFWLPYIQEHKYIALRFLSQGACEEAAPLKITPNPDIMTRVFMLFSGVEEGDFRAWIASRSDIKPSDWAAIVRVDADRARNRTLYRVLEWGGMEVCL